MKIAYGEDSIANYEYTRQWVWLPRPKYKPPKALTGFKTSQSWMGRVTLKRRDDTPFQLDGNGSEIYIYTQETMPGLLTYHWYIAASGSRHTLASGMAASLEYAAEEVYINYFELATRQQFVHANMPLAGREIVLLGNWVELGHPDTMYVEGDRAFVMDLPRVKGDKFLTTIKRAERVSGRSNDPFNWIITTEENHVITGLDWYIYKPEQYLTGNVPLCCRMCRHVSPRAFDVKWVRGTGAVCGPSRDHYSDNDLLSTANWD